MKNKKNHPCTLLSHFEMSTAANTHKIGWVELPKLDGPSNFIKINNYHYMSISIRTIQSFNASNNTWNQHKLEPHARLEMVNSAFCLMCHYDPNTRQLYSIDREMVILDMNKEPFNKYQETECVYNTKRGICIDGVCHLIGGWLTGTGRALHQIWNHQDKISEQIHEFKEYPMSLLGCGLIYHRKKKEI